MSASGGEVRRLTVSDIGRMYADGERIPMLTAYDYPTARILDDAGIPMILVGDSVGQVVLGYETTVRSRWTRCSITRGPSFAGRSGRCRRRHAVPHLLDRRRGDR